MGPSDAIVRRLWSSLELCANSVRQKSRPIVPTNSGKKWSPIKTRPMGFEVTISFSSSPYLAQRNFFPSSLPDQQINSYFPPSLHPSASTSKNMSIGDQTTSQVPRISLRDFTARREEIKAELMSAASDIGFL